MQGDQKRQAHIRSLRRHVLHHYVAISLGEADLDLGSFLREFGDGLGNDDLTHGGNADDIERSAAAEPNVDYGLVDRAHVLKQALDVV